jgi:hypothetical protein
MTKIKKNCRGGLYALPKFLGRGSFGFAQDRLTPPLLFLVYLERIRLLMPINGGADAYLNGRTDTLQKQAFALQNNLRGGDKPRPYIILLFRTSD